MSLSVCCLTGDDGGRVASLLALLRPVAHEIVVAADARVADADLQAYAQVADRLLRIEFDVLERHLGWLHAQCSGDWILRLDTDEVPGAAMLEALPELAHRRDVEQIWFPRRWTFPDAHRWLDELPWSPDFQLRMVRNDGLLRFPGHLHSSAAPVRPALYAETPFYHLACVLEPAERRRVKALRYEILAPRRQAAGGGPLNATFFLPERRPQAATAAVPAEDAALVDRVLAAPPPTGEAASFERPPVVAREENDRFWTERPVPDSAYRAEVEAMERPLRMAAGERREVFFRVRNTGTERWSWDPELPPRFRLSYRWHAVDADAILHEGERTALPHDVEPGGSAVVPLVVAAPAAEGTFDLGAGVLHEGVRWIEPLARVRAEIAPAATGDTVERPGAKAQAGPLRRLTRRDRLLVPRIIHRIWLGDAEMPWQFARYGEGWQRNHPGWEMRLWTDENLPPLRAQDAFDRSRNHSERSDILRYEVLRQFGGVYVDTDVESLRPLDDLLADVRAFAAWEVPGRMCGAVMGAVPGHPAFERAVDDVGHTVGLGAMPDSTGPLFLTLLMADFPDVTVFSPERFYPYLWDEPERRHGPFPHSHAVHHWSQTWADEEEGTPVSA